MSNNNSKDNEFKISLSVNDIDKIHAEINNLNNDLKKTTDEPNTHQVKGELIIEKQKDLNVVNGITLLNTCAVCNDKFKPVNSMIYESTCVLCSNKK